MTKEKKLSPKERYDLINQKIDEIKKLADDCVLLVHVDNASKEANTLLAGEGKAGKQAIMIDRFINEFPNVGKVMALIGLKNIIEGVSKDDKTAENKRLLTTNDALYKLCVQNLSETGRLLKAYAKYNAKLRRLEQEEAKFFRWNCIILSCIGLLMSILIYMKNVDFKDFLLANNLTK